MPIRDMDAFGGVTWKFESAPANTMASTEHGLGAPIAANRGASGIDGLISTAAGYAFGLRKAVTLLIGDVSFLHDINGLNLLRTGAALVNQLAVLDISSPVSVHWHFNGWNLVHLI